jgi:hypothetical protein
MKFSIQTIFLFLILYTNSTLSYFEASPAPAKDAVMNEISFKKWKDFQKNWHLVTVRFRQDSTEMRFTYANEIAWKTLQSLKPDYPDGAAFGKVAFMTEPDPAFPSSVVPSGTRRFQLMVRDKKKYKETDGWGYALFDSKGGLFPDDQKQTTAGCVACHRIVPERDYVFSRPAALGDKLWPNSLENSQFSKIIQFSKMQQKEIPEFLKTRITKKYSTADELVGPLKRNAFSGTLDEVMPLLIQKTLVTKQASFFIINKDNFSMVRLATEPKSPCGPPKLNLHLTLLLNGKAARDVEVCQ